MQAEESAFIGQASKLEARSCQIQVSIHLYLACSASLQTTHSLSPLHSLPRSRCFGARDSTSNLTSLHSFLFLSGQLCGIFNPFTNITAEDLCIHSLTSITMNFFRHLASSAPSPPSPLPAEPTVVVVKPIHPYYPTEIEILNFVANDLPVPQMLAIFAVGCVAILSLTWYLASNFAPRLRNY